MKEIEIGNSFRVEWTLTQLGEAFDLVGKSYEIEVSTPYGVILVNNITAEGNVLSFNVPASQQVYIGRYDISIRLTEDATGNSWALRQCDAFALMPCGCCAGNPEVVQLKSGIVIPSNGLNSYELAKAQGKFNGTLEEWLNLVMSTSIPIVSDTPALEALDLPNGAIASVSNTLNRDAGFAQHCEYIRINGTWHRLSNELFNVITSDEVSRINEIDAPKGAVLNVYDKNGDTVKKYVKYDDGFYPDRNIDAIDKAAKAAQGTADAAQSAADDAQSKADDAMNIANQAYETAEGATAMATSALTTANNAQSTANTANSNASSANYLANDARNTANFASNKSNTAVARANLAEQLVINSLSGITPKLVYKKYSNSEYIIDNDTLPPADLALLKSTDTEEVTFIDCTNVTSFNGFASGYVGDAASAKQIKRFGGLINADGVKGFESVFSGCATIESVDLSNASLPNCRSFNFAFQGATKLTDFKFPKSLPNLTYLQITFYGTKLKEVVLPKDATKISMIGQQTFASMPLVTLIDISPANGLLNHLGAYAFASCPKLQTLKITADFTNIRGTYNWQGQLVANATTIFNGDISLENFTGLQNMRVSYYCGSCPLTHESAMNCINGLYDLTEGGTVTDYTPQTLTFKKSAYDQLTEEEIAIATEKGWNLASY